MLVFIVLDRRMRRGTPSEFQVLRIVLLFGARTEFETKL
jgi:hypothetical protein